MCRPSAFGGRRCPSHANPVAIANRNARRRAQYAARVHGTQPVTLITLDTRDAVAMPMPVPVLPDLMEHKLYQSTYAGYKGLDLYKKTEKVKADKKLNVSITEAEGELVKAHYMNKKQISGVINYGELTDDSHKTLGFTGLKPGKNNRFTSMHTESGASMLSKAEMSDLSVEEKAALRFFTSQEYRWVNEALYTGEGLSSNEAATAHKPYFVGNQLDEQAYHGTGPSGKNAAMLQELTGYLDSALAKGPKQQRRVYRGMSRTNKAFGGDHKGNNIKEWVDQNISLGQEMVFDGYQSTSLDGDVAVGYADTNGLVYEIVTSSGVNVTSVSEYTREKEVVLPRGARYMVVGVHDNVHMGHAYHMTVVQLIEIDESGAVADGDYPTISPALTDTQLGLSEED